MGLLWMLIIGLVIGALAKLFMPGRDPGGLLVTMALGIGGSFVAGLLGRMSGLYGSREAAGFIASILGAMLLLAIHRSLVRRRG